MVKIVIGDEMTQENTITPVNEETNKAYNIILKGTEDVIQKDLLLKKLNTGKPLKVKLGFDPTAPDIHLGHTVVLNKIKQLQDLGHQIQILIGDFTGMIGDPTGKSETRKRLSKDDVLENAETYKRQVFKVLDKTKTEIVFNSTWFAGMQFADVLDLLSRYTVARLLERDDFTKRYKAGEPISMIEMMYPLIQGYDSVHLKSDIEIGGTDQTFNMLVGRALMKEYGQEPQVIVTMPILEGLDGVQKMSKSLGNYIGVLDSPKDMFGKLMSIPDNLIMRYLTLLTDADEEEINSYEKRLNDGENPRNVKAALAVRITAIYHGLDAAKTSEKEFSTIFSQGGLPDDIPELIISSEPIWVVELIKKTGKYNSNSEIRRLVKGGGVKLDNDKITDEKAEVTPADGVILRTGKLGFFKIVVR
jgi:tyrosyl-tRNA synthetase